MVGWASGRDGGVSMHEMRRKKEAVGREDDVCVRCSSAPRVTAWFQDAQAGIRETEDAFLRV